MCFGVWFLTSELPSLSEVPSSTEVPSSAEVPGLAKLPGLAEVPGSCFLAQKHPIRAFFGRFAVPFL